MANQCKYYKVVRQVSYDSGVTWVNIGETQKGDLYEYNSPACGAVTEYRWVDVTGQYTCEGTTKYQKTKRQYSEDGGQTWSDVSPAEYGKGDVIEYQSSDCGYVPPIPPTPGDYSTYPLTIVPSGACKFYWLKTSYTSSEKLYYSLDSGSSWVEITLRSSVPSTDMIPNPNGSKIMFKGNLASTNSSNAALGSIHIWSAVDGQSFTYELEGNILSLVYLDDFIGKVTMPTPTSKCSIGFGTKAYVTGAENLVLPLTELTPWCYYGFFDGCSNLTTVPELPATVLAEYCYSNMFKDCTSLTTVPNDLLPATELANYCCFAMFSGCSGLTASPDLPAVTLTRQCYAYMFENCRALSSVKCLATDKSAFYCTGDWLKGVSSSGTFTKAASASWSTGTSGIPTNWTIQNA